MEAGHAVPLSASRRPRRLLARWLRRAVFILPVLALGVGTCVFFCGSILHSVALARLERKTGPLSTGRWAPPRPQPQGPAARLLAVGEQLKITTAEKDILKSYVGKGHAGIRAHRPWVEILLLRNREALREVRSIGGGPSSLGLDYRVEHPFPGGMVRQFSLSRMLYSQGVLALEDDRPEEALQAVAVLSRQAAILEAEPHLVAQLSGVYVEKLQLALLFLLTEESPAHARSAGTSLLANDLGERYREAITLEATLYKRKIDGIFEDLAKESFKSRAQWFGHHYGTQRGHLRAAQGFNQYREYLGAFEHGYVWIQEHLAERKSLLDRFGESGGPDYPHFPANYRALSESRALARVCLAALPSWQEGAGCRAPAPFVAVSSKDGRCTLRTADGGDYLRLFLPGQMIPAPQECRLPARL